MHDVPPERWDAATYVNTDVSAARRGYTYTSAGSWLSGADAFDFGFFGVAKAEAAGMDPKQRLLLEVGYEVLHGAGMTKATAMGADVGVFVGMCSQDWQLISQHHRVSPYTGTGCHGPSIAANRLSYALGLRGPSFVVDTACSSSLVAADCALDKLHAKSVGSVIVAGVNLNLTPHLYVAFANAHMLSPSGRNATFDASADGYVRGEGCLGAAARAARRWHSTALYGRLGYQSRRAVGDADGAQRAGAAAVRARRPRVGGRRHGGSRVRRGPRLGDAARRRD